MATPLYNVGTATLTAGSTAMVGQGTLWEGNVRPGDQVVSYTGQTAIVGTVNSNTSITLARAFRGTNQTAQAYEILYTPDDPFTQQLAREVLQGISASALVKLGGVTPAARKLVHFDAAANAALSDLTDFALTLLDDADAASARETLLLGGYATLNPGAFGWGADATNINVPTGHLDTLTVNGVYRATGDQGSPVPGSIAQVIHMGQAAGVAAQLAFITNTGNTRIFRRTRSTANVWTPWVEFGHPLLGTVSQSGGVPTGAIIERGSNANGEYVRFADGTQICSNPDITMTRTSSPTMTGAWSYPSIFVSGSSPVVTFTVSDVLPASNRECSQRAGVSALTASIQLLQNGSWATDLTLSARAIAIGRWF